LRVSARRGWWLSVALAITLAGLLAAGGAGVRKGDARAGQSELDVTNDGSIIGGDDRARVADTTAYPYRAIAYLRLFDRDNAADGTCTGTFVGPDVLLTAGHCLWDAAAATWTAHILVAPGKDEDLEPFGSQYASNWWVPDAYIESAGDPQFDWGLVKMPDSTLGDRVSWIPIALVSTATLSLPDFSPAIVGYPSEPGKPAGTMWGHSVPAFAAVADSLLSYDVDTYQGESGSAIWSLHISACSPGCVVGIHVLGAGGGDHNGGTRITRDLLDDLLTGCHAMGCTLAYAIEQAEAPGLLPMPAPAPRGPFRAIVPRVGRD